MVKSYLRYEQTGAWGVIASNNCGIAYDAAGKLLYTGCLENVGCWSIKTGGKARSAGGGALSRRRSPAAATLPPPSTGAPGRGGGAARRAECGALLAGAHAGGDSPRRWDAARSHRPGYGARRAHAGGRLLRRLGAPPLHPFLYSPLTSHHEKITFSFFSSTPPRACPQPTPPTPGAPLEHRARRERRHAVRPQGGRLRSPLLLQRRAARLGRARHGRHRVGRRRGERTVPVEGPPRPGDGLRVSGAGRRTVGHRLQGRLRARVGPGDAALQPDPGARARARNPPQPAACPASLRPRALPRSVSSVSAAVRPSPLVPACRRATAARCGRWTRRRTDCAS